MKCQKFNFIEALPAQRGTRGVKSLALLYKESDSKAVNNYYLNLCKRLRKLNNKAKALSSKNIKKVKTLSLFSNNFFLYDDIYKKYFFISPFPILTLKNLEFDEPPLYTKVLQKSDFPESFLEKYYKYKELCYELRKVISEVSSNEKYHTSIRFGKDST